MIVRKLISRLPFIIIFFLCVFIRFYKIALYPPSLFSDEADAAYQAFTFNRCQTDYFGNKFPSQFHSFSDWRTPLFIYSIAASQKIFGTNDFSTRFPAAIYGLGSCLLLYLIIKKTTKQTSTALIGFLIASLSPWLVHYSRTGFEVSGMLMCLLATIFFWPQKSILSLIFLCASLYFYSTAKLFVFFIIILLPLLWPNHLKKLLSQTKIITIIILLVFCLPFILNTFRGTAGYRFSYISIFSDPTVPQSVDYLRNQDIVQTHKDEIGVQTSIFSKFFHNRLETYLNTFLKNYILSFSTEFLFVHGDNNLRQGFGNYGYLFWIEIPLLIIGLITIKSNPLDLLFLALLILSPIPFALTRDSPFPHATRLIIMLPSLIFFTTRGFQLIAKYKIISIIFISLYLLSTVKFYHYYFVHYSQVSAKSWHYGIKKTLLTVLQNHQNQKIFFSSKYESFLPFFLFYHQYVPKDKSCDINKHIIGDNKPYFTGQSIDNQFNFGFIDWSNLPKQFDTISNFLFVIPQSEEIQVRNSLSGYTMNIISYGVKDYLEQENFIIFTVK